MIKNSLFLYIEKFALKMTILLKAVILERVNGTYRLQNAF
jgi:hypothetical protein